jgi:protein SCO1
MIQEREQRLKRVVLLFSISLLLISLVGFVWLHVLLKNRLSAEGTRHTLPVYSRLPNFLLTESSGRPMGLIDLQGKVWIADFFFTTCPGPCPRMSARMAELQRALSNHEAARLVSITVDPDNDTPQALIQYAERFQARKDRWFFLTGEKSAIHHLAKDGFLVGGVEDVMLHTTRFMLVDRQGQLRGYYDSSDQESLKQLLTDAEILLKERTVG